MSDLNDDDLNYELGDVDCEDGLVGDEDELLLSDDESISTKLSKDQEELLLSEPEDWVKTKLVEKEIDADESGEAIEEDVHMKESIESNKKIENVQVKFEAPVELEKKETIVPIEKQNDKKSGMVTPVVKEETPKLVLKSKEIQKSKENIKVESNSRVVIATESEVTTSAKQPIVPPIEQKVIRLPFVAPPKDARVIEKRIMKANEVTSSVEDREVFTKTVVNDRATTELNMDSSFERAETDTTTTDEDRLWIDTEEELDDEREGRLNPKTCVERANSIAAAAAAAAIQNASQQHTYPHHNNTHMPYNRPPMNHHRGGGHFLPRGGFPPRPQYHPPHHPPNDMYQNSLQPPIYHSQGGGGVYHPPNGPHGPEYRPPPPPQFQNQGPRQPPPFNNFGNPHHRPPRPELHQNPNNPPFRPFNALIVRQVGPQHIGPGGTHIRPRLPPPTQQPGPYIQNQMPGQQPHYPPQQSIMHPRLPQNQHSQQQHSQQIAPPRKILLNPNFKHGGTEAAKSQLLMDTFLNPKFNKSHASSGSAQNDAELLRLQEAFINQNRMHIEKRRYDRSPDRGRERDREYSPPPPRRERRAHSRDRDWVDRGRGDGGGRGGGGYRGNERRRGNDEQYEHGQPKRRRSNSLDRDEKMNADEDDETRAYRLEIEKQKAQREKIIREKEERRKQAAEVKLKVIQTVKTPTTTDENNATVAVPSAPTTTSAPLDAPSKKLTPIVVKEGKIISLKKKTTADITSTTSSTTPSVAHVKHIPTAKIMPETKKDSTTTAVVRPQIKKQTLLIDSEFEDIDEDALLADSPSPPHTPPVSLLYLHQHNHETSSTNTNKKRRVVLKPSSDSTNMNLDKDLVTTTTAPSAAVSSVRTAKGIFDRLEKKISVNETSKRTIQRIVINNTD